MEDNLEAFMNTRKLRIITYRSNPLYRNPDVSDLSAGETVNFSTDAGPVEVKMIIITKNGIGKPLPYHIKGRLMRLGRPTGDCEIDYDPVNGTGNITIQNY